MPGFGIAVSLDGMLDEYDGKPHSLKYLCFSGFHRLSVVLLEPPTLHREEAISRLDVHMPRPPAF
jgi:hypothetical protein